MTNSIIINSKYHTIELSKKFADAAKRFGTAEYNDLQTVRKDYPTYSVVTKPSSKRKNSIKGMSYIWMESYIRNHNEELLKDFFILCGKNENGEKVEYASSASYGEVKKWFIEQFPELKDYNKSINEILNKNLA